MATLVDLPTLRSLGDRNGSVHAGPSDSGSLCASIPRNRSQCLLQLLSIRWSSSVTTGNSPLSAGKSVAIFGATLFLLKIRAQENQLFCSLATWIGITSGSFSPSSFIFVTIHSACFSSSAAMLIRASESPDNGFFRHAGDNAWHAGFLYIAMAQDVQNGRARFARKPNHFSQRSNRFICSAIMTSFSKDRLYLFENARHKRISNYSLIRDSGPKGPKIDEAFVTRKNQRMEELQQ